MRTQLPSTTPPARRPGWIACAATLAVALAAPGFASRPAVQWAPWVVGLFALGIPHGALDHRVGPWDRGPGVTIRRVVFFAGYLALAAAVLAAWWLSPMAALSGFLAVAAFHFGQGDLYWKTMEGGREGSSRARDLLYLVTRGAIPVALPVLLHADAFGEAADALAGRLFGGGSRWGLSGGARAAALGTVAALIAAEWLVSAGESLLGPSARSRRAAAIELLETSILTALFVVAPPILAVGVYFHAWHSLRHIARLLPMVEPTRGPARDGRWWGAAARFHRAALPATAGALLILSGLWLALRGRVADQADLGLLALAAVSALTLPHVLVVSWMDREQGVLDPSPSRGNR